MVKSLASSIGTALLTLLLGHTVVLAQNTPIIQNSPMGLTEQPDRYVVDTAGGLVFAVSRRNADLFSLRYKGRECQAPFERVQRRSHYGSGLGDNSQITAEQDPAGGWIKITVHDVAIDLTHYYIAHAEEPALYMATYSEKLSPPGEMRFITYLNGEVFTRVPEPSDVRQSNGVIEEKDILRNSKTGYTYSKFYGTTPILDHILHGATRDGVGCFMHLGNRETSSGGPFFRDIEFQGMEFYNCMNSGHTQTEAFRPGLKGPYALLFTDGKTPAAPDYRFIQELGLKGYVPLSGRGTLAGQATGVPPGHRAVVAIANSTAQYWAVVDAAGKYSIADALPGTYNQALYDVELAVASQSVTLSAGQTVTADIAAKLLIPPAIFRIGTCDGTPHGFCNADKIATMHPSDSRMKPFANGNFIVGQSSEVDWPMAQFHEFNNDQRITFTLTAEQAHTPLTLRIGIMLTYNDGRPSVEVNTNTPQAWKSHVPEPTTQAYGRGITRGTYRGNNHTYAFDIPPASLNAGTNTVDIHVEGNRERGTIRGIGDEAKEVTLRDGKKDVVHSYGWCLRKYIQDTKAKGMTPIICSWIPHVTALGKPIEAEGDPVSYRKDTRDMAEQEKVSFIDLYALTWHKYMKMTAEEVKKTYFSKTFHWPLT